ncbi:MAG: MDR family MFS transporter [Actinomycetaceae bacterium]|nr:MDR family MFS transporter [Actinomycetaceae bacterium]
MKKYFDARNNTSTSHTSAAIPYNGSTGTPHTKASSVDHSHTQIPNTRQAHAHSPATTHVQHQADSPPIHDEHSSRDIFNVISGLMLALFVAMMSVTIVGTSLPTMMAALHGTETHYTWVVTSMLLSSTVTTPIAGRLGDLFDKKKLLLTGIGLFTLGSLLAGASTTPMMLILTRIFQGVGMGMQMSLSQTVIATITPPRERGRYNGYLGGVMAVSTVSGPLIGGFIVATPWLGWRWSLWISVPFSLAAMAVLAKWLKVPGSVVSQPVVDYKGAIAISSGVSLLLIWLSLGGKQIPWGSPLGIILPLVAVSALIAFFFIEKHAVEPIVPLWLFTQRTPLLAIIASIAVGTALNAPPVFLGQYFQVGRGMNPAAAGLAMTPLMIGSFIFSTIIGQAVAKLARWKRFVVAGLLAMTIGLIMTAFAGASTPLWWIWIAIFFVGAGQGASMQNLVLAVQNTVRLRDIGASTATITFFRSLGGAIGVQVAGLAFSLDVGRRINQGFQRAKLSMPASHDGSMNFQQLPAPARSIIQQAYGDSIGIIFATLAVTGVIAVIAASFMKSSKLRDTIDNAAPASQTTSTDTANTAGNAKESYITKTQSITDPHDHRHETHPAEQVRVALQKDEVKRELEELFAPSSQEKSSVKHSGNHVTAREETSTGTSQSTGTENTNAV